MGSKAKHLTVHLTCLHFSSMISQSARAFKAPSLGLCVLKPAVFAIDVPLEHNVFLITELNITREFNFLVDLVLEPPTHHNTFWCISRCDF